ncbi:MAG: ATP-binding protein [Pseudomonadota bacterium]
MPEFSKTYQFQSDLMIIRGALAQIMADVTPVCPQPDDVGTVEIVLAEVLNNINEHAYEGAPNGEITAKVKRLDQSLAFEIWDKGKAMPEETPPLGKEADLDVDVIDLPEGGFGWFMIREMTEDLVYARDANQNHLMFKLAVA